MFRMTVEGAAHMQGRGAVVTGPAEGSCRLGDRVALEGAEPPRLFRVLGVALPKPGICSVLIDLDDPKEARRLVGRTLVSPPV